MRIEDRIKQKNFRNEYHRLLANLYYHYYWISAEQEKLFHEFDITFTQFNVLSILRGQQPNSTTINLIKERVLEENSDISRIVDRLVRKKLASRTVCKIDRRQADIRITKAGLDLLVRVDDKIQRLDRLVGALPEPEARQLNELLDKLKR